MSTGNFYGVSSEEALRRALLSQELKQGLQSQYPGYVELQSVRHRRARLKVENQIWTFEITNTADGRLFTVRASGHKDDVHEGVQTLAWHEASTAILALREGYKEYERERKERKKGIVARRPKPHPAQV